MCPACDSSWLLNCETTNGSVQSSFFPKHSAHQHAPCTPNSQVLKSPRITTAVCPCRRRRRWPRRTSRAGTWARRGQTWSRCRRRWGAPPGSRPRGRGCPICSSRRRQRARARRCPSACCKIYRFIELELPSVIYERARRDPPTCRQSRRRTSSAATRR